MMDFEGICDALGCRRPAETVLLSMSPPVRCTPLQGCALMPSIATRTEASARMFLERRGYHVVPPDCLTQKRRFRPRCRHCHRLFSTARRVGSVPKRGPQSTGSKLHGAGADILRELSRERQRLTAAIAAIDSVIRLYEPELAIIYYRLT